MEKRTEQILIEKIGELEIKNKELQERNKNQCKTIGELRESIYLLRDELKKAHEDIDFYKTLMDEEYFPANS